MPPEHERPNRQEESAENKNDFPPDLAPDGGAPPAAFIRPMSTINCHRPANKAAEFSNLSSLDLFSKDSKALDLFKPRAGSESGSGKSGDLSAGKPKEQNWLWKRLEELLNPGPKEIDETEPLPKLIIDGKEQSYPRSKRMSYEDSYSDSKIADPYQWLEDKNSADTKDWVKKQTELTEKYLASIPGRQELYKRLESIYNFETRFDMFKHGDKYYLWKQDGLKEQPEFCVLDDFHGKPRTILDPNKLSENGHGIVRDLRLTEDGKFASFRFSAGGHDATVPKYYDINAQKLIDKLPDGQKLVAVQSANEIELPDGSKRHYILSDEKTARNKFVYQDGSGKETCVIPEDSKDQLTGAQIAGNKIVAHYLNDACSRLKVFDLDGKFEREIELPGRGTVKSINGSANSKELLFTYSNFTTPSTIYRADLDTGKTEAHFKAKPPFKQDDFVTEEKTAISKDGTPVHLFITHKKDLKLDGNNPSYLHGYGGFRINRTPQFDAGAVPWLQDGGVYVVANLRGGAEYGENWHKQGMRENKQNVFDDFIGSAEFLIKNKYTSGDKLAIGGRSNGGLLVGATLVQRPELFAAAIPEVGLFDMLRFPKLGPGRAWEPEYGYPSNPEDLKTFLKYSPLHNLKRGVGLPAVLTMTNVNDDRVLPSHSFKFTAAAQRAQGNEKNPVLLYVGQNRGHGPEKFTSALIDEYSSKWAFLKQAMKK